MKKGPVSAIAGCVALSAFAVAILAGLSAGNPAVMVLLRAVLVMVIGYPAGLVIGQVVIRVVGAHEMTREDEGSMSENVEGEIVTDAETGGAETSESVNEDHEAVAI